MKLAQEVAAAAEKARDALVAYQNSCRAFVAKSVDPAKAHQFIAQATSVIGLNKITEGLKRDQDLLLGRLDRSETVVESFNVGSVLVPAYVYRPTKTAKAELLDKSPKGWNHVLKMIADAEKGDAVEKRLSGTVLVQEVQLIRDCGGLVNVKETDSWSVTKAKAS